MTTKQYNQYIALAKKFKDDDDFNDFIALYLVRYAELTVRNLVKHDKLDFLISELSHIE
jgi:hypothetical protein